jgi:hypothetical protein
MKKKKPSFYLPSPRCGFYTNEMTVDDDSASNDPLRPNMSGVPARHF